MSKGESKKRAEPAAKVAPPAERTVDPGVVETMVAPKTGGAPKPGFDTLIQDRKPTGPVEATDTVAPKAGEVDARETARVAASAQAAEAKHETHGVDTRLTPEAAGRYDVKGEMGRGGIGQVLLVADQHLGRDVALKVLHPSLSGSMRPSADGAAEPSSGRRTTTAAEVRFLHEARITGQLEHPGIVPVHELGQREDGTIYYTMKLVRGKTLSAAIDEAPDLRQRLELLPNVLDLCQAVAYAHSRGVIHP